MAAKVGRGIPQRMPHNGQCDVLMSLRFVPCGLGQEPFCAAPPDWQWLGVSVLVHGAVGGVREEE